MQVLATLLAKVFLWSHRLVQNADAAPVLPYFTHVALYEESASIFRKDFWSYGTRFRIAIELWGYLGRFSTRARKTRIFLMAADAACHFLLFNLFIFFIPELDCGVSLELIVPVS